MQTLKDILRLGVDRRYVAARDDIDPELMMILIDKSSYSEESEFESVCVNLAKTPRTSPEILRKIAEERKASVRGALACNSSTPTDVLELLAKSKATGISQLARQTLAKRDSGRNECSP